QFHRRQVAGAHALRAHPDDFIERREIVLGQLQILLRQRYINESALHVERQRADGVEQLHPRDLLRLLRGFDPVTPLVAALPDEIGANPVFGRACRVLRVESGTRQILEIAVEAQHRIGPQARRDNARVRDAQIVAFGHQVEVLLNRLLNGLTDGYSFWLLRLRGDRTRNARKKKKENKAGKSEAPEKFLI